MKQYKLLNNVLGWTAFFIAAVVYFMTLEPTTSFWDCPEFILSAFKLEVGHPPGNSFFNLTGRFFANFAGGDVTKVALMINSMSALCSAATILFLFWTITHLLRKLVCKKDVPMTLAQMITILGGGMVGAMVYTFSDTFWYSAVEGEVYAFSSLMTAVVFWLILKWESKADEPHSDRYIILIAYVMGLSVGVHLLNLLCIPAIVLVYYFKKVPDADAKGSFLALVGSGILILALLYGMIPGYIKLSSYVELFFVNTLGLGYNSGTTFYFFFMLAILIWGMYETWMGKNGLRARIAFIASIIMIGIPFLGSGYWLGLFISAALIYGVLKMKKLNLKLMNTVLLSLFVLFAGYSSFAQIIIRSVANPPMNQNDPDEIFSYQKYANREQYGDRPLFFGNTFVSELERTPDGAAIIDKGAPIYAKVVKENEDTPDKYIVIGHKESYKYIDDLSMFLPRMYSGDQNHILGYKEWSNFSGKPVNVIVNGEQKTVLKPTFAENMRYFFSYQLNYMYWRYFMWNFVGRQNDMQGYGDLTKGNWITGINFIDSFLVGNQDNLPQDMKDNKGRNVYYMLPLLLGIFGLIFQLNSGREGAKQFWIVFLLFFMTGIAIVLYLNQTPFQPRERDYAYAGSFYAFSIWIGMGVAYLVQKLTQLIKNENASAALVSIAALLVPVQMAAQNWDDHDRSGRYAARDFGYNYLTCIEENGVIFTNGDNDTFPLWYAQEVEGYRRDVRVCNLSYLNTDWYINQMKSPAYTSEALPINLNPNKYLGSKLNVAYLIKMTKEPLDLSTALNWLSSDDKRTKTLQGYKDRIDFLPANEFIIPIDSAAVAASPVLKGLDLSKLGKEVLINLSNKQIITKNEIATLYLLQGMAEEGWKRPIYYATTTPSDLHMNLTPYFSLVGLAYQITPINSGPEGTVNVDQMYDNMMNKFKWGGIDTPGVYLDETIKKMCYTQRRMFAMLSNALINQGDNKRAGEVLDYCMKVIPGENVPHDYMSLALANDYYRIEAKEQGDEIMNIVMEKAIDNLNWYFSLKPRHLVAVASDIHNQIATMYEGLEILRDNNQNDDLAYYTEQFEMFYGAFQQLQAE